MLRIHTSWQCMVTVKYSMNMTLYHYVELYFLVGPSPCACQELHKMKLISHSNLCLQIAVSTVCGKNNKPGFVLSVAMVDHETYTKQTDSSF